MRICVLIVTFNRIEKLKKTVEITLNLPFKNIIIVNNASTDGTESWLKSVSDERLYIIKNKINSGGAGGFKQGAKYISENLTSDWVVFYDDDAWPEKDFINIMKNINNTYVDVFCPKVVNLKKEVCKMNTLWTKIPRTFREIFEYSRNPSKYIADSESATTVMTFSFVGCAIKFTVLQKTFNHIDEKLFIYFDDVYYSYMLSQSGYILKYEPKLLMYHDIFYDKYGDNQEWKVYYLVRNMILSRYFNHEYSFFSNYAIIAKLIKFFVTVKNKKRKIKYLNYIFKGIFHGLCNIKGKCH